LILRIVLKPASSIMFKAGLGVMMAGGPIKALKGAFFGTFASLFATLASAFSGRGVLDGASTFFGKLARGCDDRCPSTGMGDLLGSGSNPFAGSGGGGNLDDLFGGFGGGGGGSLEDLFGAAGGAGGDLGDLFGGGMQTGASLTSPPVSFGTTSSPGVSVRVRTPGQKRGQPGQPSAGAGMGAGSNSMADYLSSKPSKRGGASPPESSATPPSDPIDIESQNNDDE